MGFVLADLIDYLIEHWQRLSIVLFGAQYAKRNESTKPPIGGVGFADEGGRHTNYSNGPDWNAWNTYDRPM